MLSKGLPVCETFYPFVENGEEGKPEDTPSLVVTHSARIAVFDDPSAAPRVVVIAPADIRSYLEQITHTVTQLASEQGGSIPFTVIREVVENLIHAYFREPTVSILDGGNTIRFSDQGPGIEDKERALEYGTTSATSEMKRYIRGVGSGLPYAQQWLEDKGGSLTVEDNIHQGTVVTISLARPKDELQQLQNLPSTSSYAPQQAPMPQAGYPQPYGQAVAPQGYQQMPAYPQQAWPQPYGQPYAPPYGQPYMAQQPYQTPWPQAAPQGQGYPMGMPAGMQQMTGQAPAAMPNVSERGQMILEYLRSHESVGPRDLNAWHPLSESTWSRELGQLEAAGLVSKQGGQKRRLTQQGRLLLGMY